MDEDIKTYADTLYQSTRMESAATLREDRVKTLQQRSLRNAPNLPLSGIDIQGMMRLFDAHVERCMTARFESFKQAYDETGRLPSSQDFTDILNQFKEVHAQEIENSVRSINEFIRSHGPVGVPIDNIESLVGSGAAQGS
jgi:hypothetical protein